MKRLALLLACSALAACGGDDGGDDDGPGPNATFDECDGDAASYCPLCGGDNACAVAAGRAAGDCWCHKASIDPAALAAIPREAVGKACVCAACGRPALEPALAR